MILSEKYLKSPFCMNELLEVWRNSKMKPEVFRKRILVFRLPDAAMMTPVERARCAKYWEDQFRELDAFLRAEGPELLGGADFQQHRLSREISHSVGDMLALIADTLFPRDFDELSNYWYLYKLSINLYN